MFIALSILFLFSQVERALGQKVHVISRQITDVTSSSATCWTFLCALGVWVGCITYNNVTVNKHKCMISDEFEGF